VPGGSESCAGHIVMASPRSSPRARFQPVDIREYYRQSQSPEFNRRAHNNDRDNQHRKHLIWTSKATLATGTFTPIIPTFAGRIVGVRVNVSTAPSAAAAAFDVLKDGVSIFSSGTVDVPAGALYGYRKVADAKIYIIPDIKIQCKITTVSSAGGPAVIDIEYIPG